MDGGNYFDIQAAAREKLEVIALTSHVLSEKVYPKRGVYDKNFF